MTPLFIHRPAIEERFLVSISVAISSDIFATISAAGHDLERLRTAIYRSFAPQEANNIAGIVYPISISLKTPDNAARYFTTITIPSRTLRSRTKSHPWAKNRPFYYPCHPSMFFHPTPTSQTTGNKRPSNGQRRANSPQSLTLPSLSTSHSPPTPKSDSAA